MPEAALRWAARGGFAGLLALGLTQLTAEPTTPVAPAPAAAAARVTGSFRLAGVPAGAVRSMLNIRERMRFGHYVWNDEGVPPGRLWVRVDRAAQIASVFRGPHEIATAVVLYGAPEKPTPAGRYPIRGKERLHMSRAYGAEMPYTLWLTSDGVALHAANVREGAATHGCIGLPRDFARRLFEIARKGDPVIIV